MGMTICSHQGKGVGGGGGGGGKEASKEAVLSVTECDAILTLSATTNILHFNVH